MLWSTAAVYSWTWKHGTVITATGLAG
uniref:Uncharacterized protein n=1 Tax=Arundo donax TaxID=35708 RepID=A0A0A8ZQF6_ARUDO